MRVGCPFIHAASELAQFLALAGRHGEAVAIFAVVDAQIMRLALARGL